MRFSSGTFVYRYAPSWNERSRNAKCVPSHSWKPKRMCGRCCKSISAKRFAAIFHATHLWYTSGAVQVPSRPTDGHANDSNYMHKLGVIIHAKTKVATPLTHAYARSVITYENAHKSAKLNETINGCTPDKCTCNIPLHMCSAQSAGVHLLQTFAAASRAVFLLFGLICAILIDEKT